MRNREIAGVSQILDIELQADRVRHVIEDRAVNAGIGGQAGQVADLGEA